MTPTITFEAIRAAVAQDASETGQLVWIDRRLIGLLLPSDEGWFLQFGLGAWEAEGLVFASLDAAEEWVRGCLSLAAPAALGRAEDPQLAGAG